ncbi:thiopeptide-type bacteriocin biosynthesis protein [Streptomyces sp. NPDC020875]|uniref:thiopeptide-type bacteriocin biosynthesis protein n=1 Tax=Streptomyces sp. NPDC020875 TaxID=3154898 RepID=UPI0033D14397
MTGTAPETKVYPEDSWVQINLPLSGYPVPPPLYGRLADLAREVLAAGAREFFFMHKPPGLRIRFQTADPADTPALRAELLARTRALYDRGLLAAPPVGTVYEPESYLFGGDAAMPWVHRLFTADALAWLDCHRAAGLPADGPGRPPAGWRISLLLLRELLAGLHIVGWEHRGVWEAVRSDTGRALTPADPADTERRRAEQGIRAWWARPRDEALAALPDGWREPLDRHRAAVRRAADEWRTGYFEAGTAIRGPRRAAAYAVIFHWNRGALPAGRQCLLTEALAADGAA